MSSKTALITGASAGIGLALAKQFASHGYNLVLVARREQVLRELAATLSKDHAIQAEVIAEDLAKPGAAQQLVQALRSKGIEIDTLVNNAGFGTSGSFLDSDFSAETEMMQVNMVALTQLTKLLLPAMVSRKSGQVLNVASTAAFQPGPFMAVYYATKAYVLSLTEALAEETRGTGVTVSCLCPGPTQTEFAGRAGIGSSRLFNSGIVMSAEQVAKVALQGLQHHKRLIVPGVINKSMAFSTRLAPRSVVARITRRMQEKSRAAP